MQTFSPIVKYNTKNKSPEWIEKIRIAKKGKPTWASTHKEEISKKHKGKIVSLETREKISKSSKGKIITAEQRKKISDKLKGHISNRKGKKSPNTTGDKNPMWKGGVTIKNQQIRHSIEYKLWRTAVFERDNYTCIWCGKIGGELNADHIKRFADYPELRFAIDNGRTLCKPCHITTETYGK